MLLLGILRVGDALGGFGSGALLRAGRAVVAIVVIAAAVLVDL